MPVQPESAIRGEATLTEDRDRDTEHAVAGERVLAGGEKGNGVDTGRPAESKWTRKTGEDVGVVSASKRDGSGGKRDDSAQGRETTGAVVGRVLRVLLRRFLVGGRAVTGSDSDALCESESESDE